MLIVLARGRFKHDSEAPRSHPCHNLASHRLKRQTDFYLQYFLETMSSSCNDIEQCRTRFSVVLSCLVTLFACTWVSLHPNIPSPQHRSLSRFFHRLKLMVLALIAPEVIVVWALRQRLVARQLSKGVHVRNLTLEMEILTIPQRTP